MTTSEPLIYTKDGNVPASELIMSEQWEDCIDVEVTLNVEDGQLKPVVKKKGYINHHVFYHSKATGELMRNDKYICAFGLNELASVAGELK